MIIQITTLAHTNTWLETYLLVFWLLSPFLLLGVLYRYREYVQDRKWRRDQYHIHKIHRMDDTIETLIKMHNTMAVNAGDRPIILDRDEWEDIWPRDIYRLDVKNKRLPKFLRIQEEIKNDMTNIKTDTVLLKLRTTANYEYLNVTVKKDLPGNDDKTTVRQQVLNLNIEPNGGFLAVWLGENFTGEVVVNYKTSKHWKDGHYFD